MSIVIELSSDIAAAVLARKQEDDASVSTHDLIDVVVEAHSTLRRLTTEARKKAPRSRNPPMPQSKSSAASGTH